MILHWTRCDRRKTSCATCSIATSGRKRCGTRSRSCWWHRGHPGAVAVAGHVDANTSRVVFASWHSRSSWHSTSRTSWHSRSSRHSSGASSRAPNSCNLPEPPGIPDPPGIPVVLPVEPPTAVTFPTLTLPFLTLNPKVYEYAALFSVISATFPLHFLSQAPVPFALPLPATVKVKSQVQVFLPTFTLSPVKVSARMAGTRRR